MIDVKMIAKAKNEGQKTAIVTSSKSYESMSVTNAAHADEADHAAEADNADMWDGQHYSDNLDQPVRTTDSVQFASVEADKVQGTLLLENGDNVRDLFDKSAEDLAAETDRATAAEQAEANVRQTEDTRLEGIINANQTAVVERLNTTDKTIADNLDIAKAYTDAKTSGAMIWQGVVATLADLPTNASKGDFYTVTAANNSEYAWDGAEWMNIGADVDFSTLQADIVANASAIAAEVLRAKAAEQTNSTAIAGETARAKAAEALKANSADVYTKTAANNTFQPKGNYLTEHQDISGKADQSALDAEVARAKAVEATKANDSDVVHKAGNETIGGTKSFSGNIINLATSNGINNKIQYNQTDTTSNAHYYLANNPSEGTKVSMEILMSHSADGTRRWNFGGHNAAGTSWAYYGEINSVWSRSTESITNSSYSGYMIPVGRAIYNWATPLLDAKADAKAWGTWLPESRIYGKFVVGDSSRSDFGGPFTSTNWGCTGYLDVTPGEKIAFSNYNVIAETTITGYCFYDADKKMLSGGTCIPGQPAISQVCTVLTVPSNASYFRFSFRRDESNNLWTYGMPYFIRNVGGDSVLSQLVRTVMPRFETIENMVRANFAPKDIVVSGDYTVELGNTYIYAASGTATVAPASECNVGDWFKCIVANGGGSVMDTNSTSIGRMSFNGTYLYIVIERNDNKVWAQYSI